MGLVHFQALLRVLDCSGVVHLGGLLKVLVFQIIRVVCIIMVLFRGKMF